MGMGKLNGTVWPEIGPGFGELSSIPPPKILLVSTDCDCTYIRVVGPEWRHSNINKFGLNGYVPSIRVWLSGLQFHYLAS